MQDSLLPLERLGAAIKKKSIFWGWYVVAGSFVLLGLNYGARYCFGVFVVPLSETFGWSRSIISLGASLNMLTYALCAVFIGKLIDRMAPKWIVTAGAALAGASMAVTSFISSPLELYFVYGILAGMGSACLGVVVGNSSVGKWFSKKRGLAIGISTMGISSGTILLTPVAGYIVNNWSWQTGFIALGIITGSMGILVGQFLFGKTRPEEYGLLPDGAEPDSVQSGGNGPNVSLQAPAVSLRPFLKDSRFWTLGIGYGLAVMTLMSVFIHIVPYAEDMGIERLAAASSVSAIAMAGFAGQFFFGWFSDRIREVKYSAVLGIFFMAAGIAVLLLAGSGKGLLAFTLIFGFGYGSLAPMMPIMAADRFGRDVLGSVYGLLTVLIGAGGSIGPFLAGLLFDLLGNYRGVWLIDLAILVLVAFMLFTLKPAVGVRS
ncbi:MAG TPA: MFS transporter [Syntrophales bacterium]|nr:MFS transporter [Syntrophales bacterium]